MDWDWTKKTETFPWGLSTAKNAQHISTIGYFTNIAEKKNFFFHQILKKMHHDFHKTIKKLFNTSNKYLLTPKLAY